MKSEKIGELLIKRGLITHRQLDFCLEIKKNVNGYKIGSFLKQYNFVDDIDIAKVIADQVGWKYFNGNYSPDMDLVETLGVEFLKERMVFPVKTGNGTAFVLSNVDDPDTTDILQDKFKENIKFYIGAEGDLCLALDYLDRENCRKLNKESVSIARTKESDLLSWVEGLFNRAISQGATDIHIEASERVLEIRFRIDGVLHFADCINKDYRNRLANIIFNKATVNISEFDKFHDARFTHKYLNREVDIRVSHIPSIHGSTLVLRLLDKSKTSLSLKSLVPAAGLYMWFFSCTLPMLMGERRFLNRSLFWEEPAMVISICCHPCAGRDPSAPCANGFPPARE